MLLDKLQVLCNGRVTREISFKAGLNLIVDSTELPLQDEKPMRSGNSVGKTTVLRAIDYCLGSSGEDIYMDPEFRTRNEELVRYFSANDVFVRLTISRGGAVYVLERDLREKPRVFLINEELIKNAKQYRRRLKEIIFLSSSAKPMLREVMPKFLRTTSIRMSNTLKFLHGSTSDVVYESIMLFLFGFSDQSLIDRKQAALKEQKKLKDRLRVLSQEYSATALEQMLLVVEGNIKEKQSEVSEFRISSAYQSEAQRLQEIQKESSQVAVNVNSLQLSYDMAQDAIENLRDNLHNADADKIANIYAEAKVLVPDLHKRYEDVLEFHNKMVRRKLDFIEKNQDELLHDLRQAQNRLNQLHSEEQSILSRLEGQGTLNDLVVLQEELGRLNQDKGGIESQLSSIRHVEKNLDEVEREVHELDLRFEECLDDLKKKLAVFNKHFSRLSKRFYDENYFLSFEFVGSKIKFKVDNVVGNVGGGKKKGQVAAFDLAYSMFIDELQLKSLSFVAHDSIEDVHQNQIRDIFSHAESQAHSQYIVAVLKGVLVPFSEDFLASCTRVELNENDKFFNI